MSARAQQMPDFAGVALVDILANGVGMLIIVIVVSIASRVEREEQYAEQADEVASVMSHKFSTSLVLNSLAASPPAVLHNYETSAIDQVLTPQALPIIELHPGFVREYYSGARWPRAELLREFNGMHAWLQSLDELQKRRMRADIYGIGQYYLAMSILREHGIRITHWHFLSGAISLADAANCPPGVAAKDCIAGGDINAEAPAVSGGAGEGGGAPGNTTGDGDSGWPPKLGDGDGDGDGGGGNGDGDSPGRMPAGAVPGFAGGFDGGGGGGGGQGGGGFGDGDIAGGGGGGGGGESGNFGGGGGGGGDSPSAAELGSFPGLGGGGGGGGGSGGGRGGQGNPGGGGGGGDDSIQFRLALPDNVRAAAGAGAGGVPALDVMFAALLHYLSGVQDTLDSGLSPAAQIANFAESLRQSFASPPPLSPQLRMLARELAVQFAFLRLLNEDAANTVTIKTLAPGDDAALIVTPNQLIDSVGVRRTLTDADLHKASQSPEQSRVSLRLNAFPGIWQGLEVRLETNALLLMPPQPRAPGQQRWRALAYLSPKLDEVVAGFALADIDAAGALRLQADAGGVRLGGRALFSRYVSSAFGARGWLVTLYAILVAGLLLLALARRRFGRGA